MKLLHRWTGIILAIFIILFAASGIVLNHRSFFSRIDVPRKLLPKTYQYHNWNFSAVKSGTFIGADSLLIYGNIGIWLTDSAFSSYEPYYAGIRKGTDNRRTASIVKTERGNVFAGTMSGLYQLHNNQWQMIPVPVKERRIVSLLESPHALRVMTRSHLLHLCEEELTLSKIGLKAPYDHKPETSLFRALWVIHSGKILGTPGKLFVDLMGLAMIFLSVTGIIWFVAPDTMKMLRKKVNARKKLAKINRFSLKWHNHVGIWLLVFFLILTITGMFLRPPLLIPIVTKTFPAIKHTILAHPNPWYDKLRDIHYDRFLEGYILSTSDGFYYSEPHFEDSLARIPHQPPISVMGINVFEQPEDGVFITGSFSGILRWIPAQFEVFDFITGAPVTPARGMANPFGSIPVAGYLSIPGKKELLFDYNAGVLSLKRGNTPPVMPEIVKRNSPMPLWNLALEIHTGRFYSFFLGRYYILFIPIVGLATVVMLISGTVVWWRKYRKKVNP